MNDFKLLSNYTGKDSPLEGAWYEHSTTGLQVVILKNEDTNRTFSINLLTPPRDSKGTPHILEHSVLCGSKNFPLKDPFAALLRSSLHTFLNAFTAHSYTSYPAASQNEKDFFNLFTVYWDAVFNPLLTPETFARQAWHYRLEESLARQGVVYNEMKGRYADADSAMYRAMLKTVFPKTHYENDSGGDPKVIPSLTYDELKAFHAECYHPSNARVMVYGEVHAEAIFKFLSEKLKGVAKQNRLEEERIALHPLPSSEIIEPYQPSGGNAPGKDWITTCNWRIPYDGSLTKELSWIILEDVLFGSQGSPLYLALMNSGLGDKVAGFGLVDTNHDAFFSCGMRNIKGEDRGAVKTVVYDALKKIADGGISAPSIEAVINSFEFRLREQVFNASNKGIQLLSYVTSSWLFHNNPFRTLSLLNELTNLKSKLTPEYLQNMVRKELLEAPMVQISLSPDRELFAKAESEEASELASIAPSLTEEQKKNIHTTAALVDDATPDPEELLSKIPTLTLGDLDRPVRKYNCEVENIPNGVLLSQQEDTTGIVYFQIGFNLLRLQSEERMWVPLLSRVLTGTGTKKRTLIQLTEDIQRDTGGIGSSRLIGMHHVTKEQVGMFFLEGSALNGKIEKLSGLIAEIAQDALLSNKERILQILGEMKVSLQQGISSRPSAFAQKRATRKFSFASALEDDLSGFGQFEFLKKVLATPWDEILSNLEKVKSKLFMQSGLVLNITAEQSVMSKAKSVAKELADIFPVGKGIVSAVSTINDQSLTGVVAPIRVGYTSFGLKTEQLPKVSAEVVMNYLSDTYLWNEIRVAGGAYGSTCGFDRDFNFAHFYSWDDPNPKRTFEVYQRAGEFLRKEVISQEEITRSIIGTIGSIDQPLSPAAKGSRARMLYVMGVSDEERQMRRNEILDCTAKDFAQIGNLLSAAKESCAVYVHSEEGVSSVQKEVGGAVMNPLKD